MEVVCPQCTSIVRAEPGTIARCGHCGYSGGSVPGAHEVQVFSPPKQFLPSDPFPEDKDEEEEEETTKKETSHIARTALILGFAGIPLFLAGPVAVGFGIAGMVHVNQDPEHRKGKALAIIGLMFGFLSSIVWTLLIVGLFAGAGTLL